MSGRPSRTEQSSFGWAASIEICADRRAVQLGEEGVAREPGVDDVRVAEAGVQHGVHLDPFEGAVDRG